VTALAGLYYLVAALAVTMWRWRDPVSRLVAANLPETLSGGQVVVTWPPLPLAVRGLGYMPAPFSRWPCRPCGTRRL
jgi:hypothetical protein